MLAITCPRTGAGIPDHPGCAAFADRAVATIPGSSARATVVTTSSRRAGLVEVYWFAVTSPSCGPVGGQTTSPPDRGEGASMAVPGRPVEDDPARPADRARR